MAERALISWFKDLALINDLEYAQLRNAFQDAFYIFPIMIIKEVVQYKLNYEKEKKRFFAFTASRALKNSGFTVSGLSVEHVFFT